MSKEFGRHTDSAEWFAALVHAELSQAQKVALTDWLRESPTHVRELLEHSVIRHDLSKLNVPPEQVDAWVREARVAAREPPSIASDTRDADGDSTGHRIRRHAWWMALAASIVLVVSGAAAGYLWRLQDGRYVTSFGEQRLVTLEDGSVVSVNTDSALKVRFSKRHRTLELQRGEAYFRVAHDASRPFEVIAGGTTVQALGTQFNVRLAPKDTIVSVIDGQVEVRAATAAAGSDSSGSSTVKIQLARGEQARIRHAGGQPPSIDKQSAAAAASRVTAWTRGLVEFDAMSLTDVIAEFRRYRDIDVTIDDESLATMKLTGSFDAHDPVSFLDYLAILPDVEVQRLDERTYVIRRR